MHVAFATVCRPASQGGSREGQAASPQCAQCGQMWAAALGPPLAPASPPLPSPPQGGPPRPVSCRLCDGQALLVPRSETRAHSPTTRTPARALSSSL